MHPVPQFAIIADDLTGAADAGGAFASVGLATTLMLHDQAALAGVTVVTRSTGSRGMDAVAAAAATRDAVEHLQRLPAPERPTWFYKKIDSALRGNPGPELRALMAALGERRAVVAPALPAEGRTTVGSRQYLQGVPIEQTAVGASTPDADVRRRLAGDEDAVTIPLGLEVVRQGAAGIASMLGGVDAGLVIADAETDRDLESIARGAIRANVRVLAGSAGLARQVALLGATSPPPAAGANRGNGPALVVAASRHPSTAGQVDALREAGVPVVRPSQEAIDGIMPAVDAAVSDVADHLARQRPVVLTTIGLAASRQGSAHVVRHLAEIVAALADRGLVGGLVLTGGDVAAGVLDRLEVHAIALGGEVRPAMPWGTLRSRRVPGIPVVTKAGSFGEIGALMSCLEFLRGDG